VDGDCSSGYNIESGFGIASKETRKHLQSVETVKAARTEQTIPQTHQQGNLMLFTWEN
jgi:hypothetical protein